MKSKVKMIIVIVFAIMALITASQAEQMISVVLDGNTIVMDENPRIINNRVMVPVRFVSENMGAKVDWNNDTRTVEVVSPVQRFSDGMLETGMYLKTAEEALDLVNSGKAVVLDVRSQELRDISYIEGSMHIPTTQLTKRTGELPIEKIIVVYCMRNISAAYGVAMLNMLNMEAYMLVDGMEAWEAVGGKNVVCRR